MYQKLIFCGSDALKLYSTKKHYVNQQIMQIRIPPPEEAPLKLQYKLSHTCKHQLLRVTDCREREKWNPELLYEGNHYTLWEWAESNNGKKTCTVYNDAGEFHGGSVGWGSDVVTAMAKVWSLVLPNATGMAKKWCWECANISMTEWERHAAAVCWYLAS